jgi:hypothetical protein
MSLLGVSEHGMESFVARRTQFTKLSGTMRLSLFRKKLEVNPLF